MEMAAPFARLNLVVCVALVTSLARVACQELGDFDEVETYTRILLRTKNGSSLVRPRADPGGPLIIDYPFSMHHLSSPHNSEFSVHPATQVQPIPYSGLQQLDTHEGLTSWHNYGAGLSHPNLFFPSKKKKKKYLKKSHKYLIPLLITVAAKIAHLLPTLKLLLLALFSLLLFAKKAFLVSVGTFLLVLYEHFTSKNSYSTSGLGSSIGLWKDRGQAVVGAQDVHLPYGDQGVPPDNQSGSDWWRLEGANGTKITPRDGERWRRWWAPQVKGSYYGSQLPPQLEEQATLKDRIKSNIKRIFGGSDYNS